MALGGNISLGALRETARIHAVKDGNICRE